MRLFLAILLIISVLACSKSGQSTAAGTAALAGQWRASAFGYLDHNGDRKWEPEHVSNPPSLYFDSNGVGTFSDTLAGRVYFKVLSGSQLELVNPVVGKTVCNYQVTAGQLTITGDCSHYCGEIYLR